ncbi:MAG TPA: molybdopterin-dependent oxidoreductase [Sphingopyxis sp.]|nr:molybdopterin-dependent oxidoreductase [Sphingopyxis sp.]
MLRRTYSVVMVAAAFLLSSCAAETTHMSELAELAVPEGDIVLEVRGNLARINGDGVAQFDMAMLMALPSVQLKTSTSVTDGVRLFEGVLVRDLLKSLGAQGHIVSATARNKYVIDIPFTDFERFDAIIAYRMDGEPMDNQDKGPLWIVYPRDVHSQLQDIRYDYRWVWQLKALEIK